MRIHSNNNINRKLSFMRKMLEEKKKKYMESRRKYGTKETIQRDKGWR